MGPPHFRRISDQKQSGTGLGLSITRAMVEAQNGTIGFMSGDENGTTFYFDLPVSQPPTEITLNS